MSWQRNARWLFASGLLAACGGGAGGGADAGGPDSDVPEGVAAIPLSTPDGSFYTADVMIGSQTFAMVVDTGSTTAGIAHAACAACTTAGVTPLYQPGTGAADTHQSANAMYGDQSGWTGEVYTDQIGLQQGTPDVAVNFAAITTENGFFHPGNLYQGILGLGGPGLLSAGTTSYLDKVTAAGVTAVASFEMCDDRGTMWLGGYDPAAVSAAPKYTPMNTALPFYTAQVQDVKLGDASIGWTSSLAIVDTGTSLFYMPTAALNGFVAAANAAPGLFTSAFTFDSAAGVYCAPAADGTDAAKIDAQMPAMSFTFPDATGGSFSVSAAPTRSYMLFDPTSDRWCLGIGDGQQIGLGNFALMGDTAMRGFVTIFDLVNGQTGFAPDQSCLTSAGFTKRAQSALPVGEHGRIPTITR